MLITVLCLIQLTATYNNVLTDTSWVICPCWKLGGRGHWIGIHFGRFLVVWWIRWPDQTPLGKQNILSTPCNKNETQMLYSVDILWIVERALVKKNLSGPEFKSRLVQSSWKATTLIHQNLEWIWGRAQLGNGMTIGSPKLQRRDFLEMQPRSGTKHLTQ